MSWLGGGISQLTGQISNFTREVLSEGTEEVSDHVSELKVTKDKVQELELVASSQRLEIERLKQLNHELEEKAESAELQINAISKEYRNLLEEKEGEVKALKQKQNELLEMQKKMAASAAAWGSTAFSHSTSTSQLTSPYVEQTQKIGHGLDHHDGMDFEDVISSQHEINQLSQQVHSLQAEVNHWRQVAASLGGLHGEQEGGQSQEEVHKLKQEVQELRQQLGRTIDDHQNELTALQDVHSQKLTALKRQQRQETKQLQEEIAELQQQIDESFSNSGEENGGQERRSGHSSQLSAILQEKEMVEQELEKSRTGEKEKTRKLQVLTKQMEGLQKEKQELTDRIENLRKAEEKLQLDLSAVVTENGQLKDELAQKRSVLAGQDDDHSDRLREENVELQTQVQQLKKELESVRSEQERYQTAMEDLRLELLDKSSLRRTDSEETLEHSNDNSANITGSFGVDVPSSTPLHPTAKGSANQSSRMGDSDTGSVVSTASDISWRNRQLDEQVQTLQTQIDKYEQEIMQFEMVQSDWTVEKQALEDVLGKLRGQLRQKEESLNVVQAAKGLIEVGKHERQLQRAGRLNSPPVEMVQKSEAAAASFAAPSVSDAGDIHSNSPVLSTDSLEHERDALFLQKNHLEQEVQQLRGQLQEMGKAQTDTTTEASPQQETDAELEELRHALQEKIRELQDVTEEKDALIESLDELDSQHQVALVQVLKTRDDLKNQLSTSMEHASRLQHQLEGLEADKQKLSLELSSLQNVSVTNSMVEDEISRLREQLEHSTEEKEEAMNTKSQLTEQLTELRQRLMQEHEAATHRVKDMEMELDTSRHQVQELSSVKDQLLHRLQMEEEKLQRKDLDLSQELTKVNRSVNEAQLLTQEKSQLLREIESLQDQLDEGGRALSRLQAEKGKLTHTVSSLQQNLEDLRSAHDSLLSEKDDLSKTCTDLECKLQSAENQINSLEDTSSTENGSNNGQIHQELSSLQQELDHTRQVGVEYRAKLEKSELRLRDLEEKLTHLAEDNENLQETLGSMKANHRAQTEALEARYTKFNEDLETQIDSLKDQKESLEKDLDLAEGKLYDQTKHYEKYIKELAASRELDANSLQAEHEKLMQLTHAKDREIRELKSRCEELTEELKESKEMLESTFEGQKPLTDLLQERENELSELKAENASLTSHIDEQTQKLSDQEKLNSELAESKKQASSFREENIRLKTEVTVLKEKEDKNKIDTKTLDIITDLESEITSLHGKLRGKDKEIEELKEMITELETGITDLNEKSADQVGHLQESEEKYNHIETKMVVLNQTMLQKEDEIIGLTKKLERAKSLLDKKQQTYVESEDEIPLSPNFNLPAIEYKSDSDPILNGFREEKTEGKENEKSIENEMNDKKEFDEDGPSREELEQETSDLRKILHEKDEVITSMQENNDSLLKMLEDRSFSIYKDRTLVDLHKAQNQVKSLQVEREQILSVLNEKTREGSSLKSEVHRLMSVISAEKAAISKLQEDNQKLVSQSPVRESPDEDMTREAIQNLSHMVRNKEMEIEALKQKNETLLMVLQESSSNTTTAAVTAPLQQGGGAGNEGVNNTANNVQVGLLMQERENLAKQLAAYQQDREQIVAALTQKHQESVAYHSEIQRLTACLSTEAEKMEKVQTDYKKLTQQFEDRQHSLVKAQNDLANYKQKYQELDERYQELSQHQFGQVDTVDLALYNSKCEEINLLNDRLRKQSESNSEKDFKVGDLMGQVNKKDELLSSRESELSTTKKKLESLTFQLDGVHAELKDVEKDRGVWKQRTTEQQSENEMLKESLNRMSLSVREKDFEMNTLQEKCKTLTKMYEEKGDNNSPQLQQMLRDCESWQAQAQTFRQERDQAVLNMQQVHAENKNIINELQALRDQNQKAQKELERLRNHLLQTEESYVQEALQAEDREKQLLNRLHSAEEKALASDTAIQESDQLKDQHIESLKDQLYVMSQKKDEATAQLIQTQGILQQYAASVTNLQMVLEKFQADKTTEEEVHQEQIKKAQEESMQLKAQIAELQNQIVETSDALDAAQRLSEQIDRKEDVVQALKEEVQQRDELLREASERIRQLTNTTEGQVDKLIMKNLFMGYFHTPPAKRQDVVMLISRVLDFTTDEINKVLEESSGGGARRWIPIPSIWNLGRSAPSTPNSPKTSGKPHQQQQQKSFDQSFSELFVKFLERESSPQPQLKLPVDQMVKEEQEKQQQQQQKSTFNPFAAPRHVAFPLQMASAEPSSELLHPLMKPVTSNFGGLADLKLSPLPTLLADSSNTSSLNNTPNTSRPSSRQDKPQQT